MLETGFCNIIFKIKQITYSPIVSSLLPVKFLGAHLVYEISALNLSEYKRSASRSGRFPCGEENLLFLGKEIYGPRGLFGISAEENFMHL
jgi:hypothetical protein